MALLVCSPVFPPSSVHGAGSPLLHGFIVVGDRLHRESFRLVARREPHGLGFSLLYLPIPDEPGIGSGAASSNLGTRWVESYPFREDPNTFRLLVCPWAQRLSAP